MKSERYFQSYDATDKWTDYNLFIFYSEKASNIYKTSLFSRGLKTMLMVLGTCLKFGLGFWQLILDLTSKLFDVLSLNVQYNSYYHYCENLGWNSVELESSPCNTYGWQSGAIEQVKTFWIELTAAIHTICINYIL